MVRVLVVVVAVAVVVMVMVMALMAHRRMLTALVPMVLLRQPNHPHHRDRPRSSRAQRRSAPVPASSGRCP